MKIGELLKEKGNNISFEFFPPKEAAGEEKLFEAVHRLEKLDPTFVSMTYGAGGSTRQNTRNMVVRLKKETKLTIMPHLTCVNQTRQELKTILEDYRTLCIENVLALRGDPPKDSALPPVPEGGIPYAKGVVELAASVGGFSIGVAIYPEGHPQAPSLEMDMEYTRQKVDAGASFAVSQMFFDNRYLYQFLERAEKHGIRIPVLPGIMPIVDINRIKQFSEQCGAVLPESSIRRFDNIKSPSADATKIGIDLATEQCADLLKNGVRYLHFYTLNRSDVTQAIIDNLGLRKPAAK
jgi:methylenetetrahydrofolate reductase (NADPH)